MRPIVHCQLINGPFGDPVLYAEIMFERRGLLFDIGDIASLASRKLLRVSHVFVSHAHMDHFVGFDHLLRVLLGRDKTVAVYGPAGFIDQVEHKLHAYTWNVVQNYVGAPPAPLSQASPIRQGCQRRRDRRRMHAPRRYRVHA